MRKPSRRSVRAKRRSRNKETQHLKWSSLEPRRLLAAGNGLQGQYFDTSDLTGPAFVRIDANVNFNWGSGSPNAAINADTFSTRWSGQVEAQFTESHNFYVVANDGARLWINGQLLIDNYDDATTNATASIDLISGRRYDIQLEYRENTGSASIRLEWSSDSQGRQVIPQDFLFASGRGEISVQRFDNISGSAISNLTSNASYPELPTTVDVLASFESAANIGSSFGQRLVGYLHPPENGPYTFYISGDQSAELWLSNSADPGNRQRIAFVNSPTGVREWTASSTQESAPVYLAAGQSYFIEILHKESTGADHVSAGWIKPGQSNIEVISGDYLSTLRPTVRGFAIEPNAAEGDERSAVYEITRTGPTNNALVVSYELSGSATNGEDYIPLSGSITIPAGAESALLNIIPISNSTAIPEDVESVVLEIQQSQSYNVGLKSERTFNATIQDSAVAPEGGIDLWTSAEPSAFTTFGGSFSTFSDSAFGDVLQATIGNVADEFSAQLRQSIDVPVNAGDILFVEFFARSAGGDGGQITAVFEQNTSPFSKSLLLGMSLTDQWTKVQLPFNANDSYSAGDAGFSIFLGAKPQTLQFAAFKLLGYGASTTLAPGDDLILNNIGGNYGLSDTVAVSGQPFTTAFEVETTTVPPQAFRLQSQESNSVAVENGETMRFEFSLRATAGSNPQTQFALQETTNYDTLFSQSISLTSQWQSFSFDVQATEAHSIGGLSAVLNLGFGLQTVEIGDFSWSRVGQGITIDQLPSQSPSSTYGGRDANSDWRETANQRIESERKSNATVNVIDSNGVPLEGAVVSLRQNEHAFTFGSAITALNGRLSPAPTETSQTYQDEINRLFNAAVVENSHKWEQFISNRARGIEAANFAVDNDLYLRGHNIIWPSRDSMPESVWNEYDLRVANDGTDSANNWLHSTIDARFDDVLNTFDGQISEWDVVNEPFNNRDVMDLLGDQVLVDWFQRVRDFDPDIKLTLNDFNIFTSNGNDVAHRNDFEFWLGLLNNANLLDVIGIQSHFSSNGLTDIDVLEGLITDYDTQFGKTIAITEFDVATFDEQLQADYLRDYLTQSFSQPGVSEFIHWGFWEGAHFRPEAALYRQDFSVKPNGQAYEDLVFGSWWSDIQGTTTGGSFTTQVFDGQYDVVIQYAGQTYNAILSVDNGETSSVSVSLPLEAIQYGAVLTQTSDNITGNALSTLTNSGTWFEPEGQTVGLNSSLGQVTLNSDGTWDWQLTTNQRYDGQPVVITANDAAGGSSTTTFTINTLTNVGRRGVSYGNSGAFSETEMPSGIEALLPGQTASQTNFTNYYLGLNRVVIEVAGLASSAIDASDFDFRIGNTTDPDQWMLLDSSSSIPLPAISVVAGVSDQPDKIVLAWADNVVQNTWLQVTIKPTASTGLDEADVFYLGNQIGDINGDVNSENRIRVNSFDTIFTRLNQAPTSTVDINEIYDVDRNGRVNSFDVIRVRVNQSLGGLLMFSPPLPATSAAATSVRLAQLPITVEDETASPVEELIEAKTEVARLVKVTPVRATEVSVLNVSMLGVSTLPASIQTNPRSAKSINSAASRPVVETSPVLSSSDSAIAIYDFSEEAKNDTEQTKETEIPIFVSAIATSLAGSQELAALEADRFFAKNHSEIDFETSLADLPKTGHFNFDASKNSELS